MQDTDRAEPCARTSRLTAYAAHAAGTVATGRLILRADALGQRAKRDYCVAIATIEREVSRTCTNRTEPVRFAPVVLDCVSGSGPTMTQE